MNAGVEIAIAAAVQLGTLIWFLSGMRSNLSNLTGWVRSVAREASEAKLVAAELKGHVAALPCSRCAPTLEP